MGEVYRAHDPDLGRDVALKVLPPELGRNAERLQRFQREAESLAAIDHPGIVTIHSVEESDGLHFLTMALVEGSDLAEIIPPSGLPAERFFPLATALAEALTAAHQRGIVHRDLKPANVRVTRDGQLKVLDFGLARPRPDAANAADTAPTDLVTRRGELLGTVPYMSPEQARGEAADERSDIFSLGCVLHEMATGRPPFSGRNTAELTSAILRDDPTPVDALRSDLPHHLGRVIRRCLRKDPGERYQTARDVANELADLGRELDVETVAAEMRGPEPSEPPVGRRLLWVAAVVLLAVVAAAWWLGRGRAPDGGDGQQAAEPVRIRALAVLPFKNLMRAPDQAYLVDGMHDALITDLSKIEPLRVISRTSVARYRDTRRSLPEIARELDVDALVEGSVLRSGDRVRITAQLIDGATDEHLWASSFDRDLVDLFALLSDVARAISEAIEVTLTPETSSRLGGPQMSAEVQEAYLRGMHYIRGLGGAEDHRTALGFFERALELEPTLARAWAGKAIAHLFLGGLSRVAPEEQARRAREAADRALGLDPAEADALTARGWLSYYFGWDWRSARADFERALEVNPNHWGALHGAGEILTFLGSPDDGLVYLREAKQRDPLAPATVRPYLWHLMLTGRYEEVLVEIEKAAAFDPGVKDQSARAASLWLLDRRPEAIEAYRQLYAGTEGAVEALDAGAAEGGPREALTALARHRAKRADGSPVPMLPAVLFALAGEADEALRVLETAYDQRNPQLGTYLGSHPAFDPLRSDPRFKSLMRRVGIPLSQ